MEKLLLAIRWGMYFLQLQRFISFLFVHAILAFTDHRMQPYVGTLNALGIALGSLDTGLFIQTASL